MAKNIMNLTNKISKVAKESFEKANDKKIVWIKDEDLLDHPMNDEDISYTEDIEEHIKTEGFRYPITITTFGVQEHGKYYIVSGHRSRMAGRNLGKKEFPCIIEDYASDTEVYHAILSGNTRRNKDPLDLANKYRKWNKYLDMIGFKGNRSEKIGACLGISAKQAEKYKAFNKIIPEFWQLVREKNAAKDALYQLAPKSSEEQLDIYNFFLICCDPDTDRLSVSLENNIIAAYRIGARSYEDYQNYLIARGKISSSVKENDGTDEIQEETQEKTEKEIEKVSTQSSILSEVNSGLVKKDIEGRNDNQAANKELHQEDQEEKQRYKEERLTEEDMNLAERSIKNFDKDIKKEDNQPFKIDKSIQQEQSMNVLGTTEEHIEYISELIKQIKKDNEYNSIEDADGAIDKVINAAIKMLDIADKIRDENAAYEGWNNGYEKLNKYLDKPTISWN